MLPFVVGNPLVVVVEADLFGGQELETPHFVSILFGQVNEILAIFSLRVGIVDDNTGSLLDLFLSHLVALLFGLQSVPVYPCVLGHVVLPEGRFA